MSAGAANRKRLRVPTPQGDYERMLLMKELEWMRTLTHVAPAGIYRVDAAGLLTYVNESWSRLTGRSANEAIGSHWALAVHPDDVELLRSEWRRSQEERVPFRVEHRYVQPNGRTVWALTLSVREVDGRGETTGYTGMTTDITELHRIREELQRSHQTLEVRMRSRSAELQRMARIVETIDDAVLSCDLEGRVLTWNRAAESIFGYSAIEMIGQPIYLVAPESRQDEARMLEMMARQGNEIRRFESLAVTKAGQIIEIAISGFPLRDENDVLCGSWAIVRDITERKSAERRLHRLSWRLMKVQDEERRRIARNLHDSTAQALAALSMNLTALERENPPLSEERRRQILQDSVELASRATAELRTSSYLLHPPLLDERGLRSALGWLVDGFVKRSGIKVSLDVAPAVQRLESDVEFALFNVAQEALHNVHRHSGSDTAEIRLGICEEGVRLEIRDRGRGLAEPAKDAVGVGIAGMRERLLEFGGQLLVEPAQPGTRVIGIVPLKS